MKQLVDSKFLSSYRLASQCREDRRPEYACIGRSNVGKSSLINLLTYNKGLAKTSGKPGKTSMLNHFLVKNQWLLMDLPGYGWAKLPSNERKRCATQNQLYLRDRKNLVCVFTLLDIRLPPQTIDLSCIQWLIDQRITFKLCFTKADKILKRKWTEQVKAYETLLPQHILEPLFITSAHKKWGRKELLTFIEEENKLYYRNSEPF